MKKKLILLVAGLASVALLQNAAAQVFENFDSYDNGTVVMFQKASYSGSTSAKIVTTGAPPDNTTVVTDQFPAGLGQGKVLGAWWTWVTGVSNPWDRMTTYAAGSRANPVIDITQCLAFSIWANQPLYVGVGVRETATASLPIGSAGPASGGTGIEWVGASGGTSGTAPILVHLVEPGVWTRLVFNLPNEPVTAFTGNGILASAAGNNLAVFEHLTLAPAGAPEGQYIIYLDDFEQYVVPEPATCALLASLGLIGFAGWRRLRK